MFEYQMLALPKFPFVMLCLPETQIRISKSENHIQLDRINRSILTSLKLYDYTNDSTHRE